MESENIMTEVMNQLLENEVIESGVLSGKRMVMSTDQRITRGHVLLQRVFGISDILMRDILSSRMGQYLQSVFEAAKECYGEGRSYFPTELQFVNFARSLIYVLRMALSEYSSPDIKSETETYVEDEIESIEEELEYFE